jgi:hypothetical protein
MKLHFAMKHATGWVSKWSLGSSEIAKKRALGVIDWGDKERVHPRGPRGCVVTGYFIWSVE